MGQVTLLVSDEARFPASRGCASPRLAEFRREPMVSASI